MRLARSDMVGLAMAGADGYGDGGGGVAWIVIPSCQGR
jgi:hypothetical protein